MLDAASLSSFIYLLDFSLIVGVKLKVNLLLVLAQIARKHPNELRVSRHFIESVLLHDWKLEDR